MHDTYAQPNDTNDMPLDVVGDPNLSNLKKYQQKMWHFYN